MVYKNQRSQWGQNNQALLCFRKIQYWPFADLLHRFQNSFIRVMYIAQNWWQNFLKFKNLISKICYRQKLEIFCCGLVFCASSHDKKGPRFVILYVTFGGKRPVFSCLTGWPVSQLALGDKLPEEFILQVSNLFYWSRKVYLSFLKKSVVRLIFF